MSWENLRSKKRNDKITKQGKRHATRQYVQQRHDPLPLSFSEKRTNANVSAKNPPAKII